VEEASQGACMIKAVFKAEVLKAAREYAAQGWRVFPCHTVLDDLSCSCSRVDCGSPGKHPRTPNGLKDASSDKAQIDKLFGPNAPVSNLAVLTGEPSDLTVIDVDMGEGKHGAETWRTLIEKDGEPETLIANTGGGGLHLVFSYCPTLKSGSNRLGEHVDVKNDGGYVIVAPSCHRSGDAYSWANWGTPLIPVPGHLMRKKETRGRKCENGPIRRKYGLSDVITMLAVIPADDRDLWRHVGIILGRTFNRSDEAWAVYVEWAAKWRGKKDRKHDQIMHECFYTISQESADSTLSVGTIVYEAMKHGWVPTIGRISFDALYYHVGHGYLYRPTMETWPAKDTDIAVSPVMDDGVIRRATEVLQRRRMVTCVTTHPALAEYTPDMNMIKGELVADRGAAVLNVYRHPTVPLGDAMRAEPWVKHCQRLFNKSGDSDQFFNYMAHRAQRPGEKPRFALLIGGEQGTGKDSAIEMCLPAIGPWNVENITPAHLQSAFNAYLACTLLRVNEAANAADTSRWMLNEQLKNVIAGAPDHATINGKYQVTQHIKLYCGVIVTTNHLLSSIFIPEDDRRFDVIACATKDEMGLVDDVVRREYFEAFWGWWYADGNAAARHVAAFLHEWSLTGFSPALGQRKTAAHRSVVHSGMASDEWCADALAKCSNKEMISGSMIYRLAVLAGEDPKSLKARLPHAMDRMGYIVYPNLTCKDGRHTINGKLHKIFMKPNHQVSIGWEATLDGYPEFSPI
jgi:hypothetical protein